MRVLVTGGAGFIGSHNVDALIEQGHEVSVIDNFSEGDRANLNPHARLFDLSVNDLDGINRAFAETRPEVVSHHAAQNSVRNSLSDPTHDAQVNIIGSSDVLQCAVMHNVKRIIFASSSAVYANPRCLPFRKITRRCRSQCTAFPNSV